MMSFLVSLLLCILFMSGCLLTLGIKEDDANVIVTNSCIEKERKALLDVRDNLNHSFFSWGSNDEKWDCCKWVGVKCNNHTGHVIGLDVSVNNNYHIYPLDFNGLVITACSSLQVLNQLQYLNLRGIPFQSSQILNFLGSFTNLRSLDLSGANLSGPIPKQLGNLYKLLHLDLSRNFLSGFIPFSSGVFTSLNYLNLSRNELGGVIPKSFANWSSLVQLDLSDNHLNGSVPSFDGYSSLKDLILHSNALHGGVPNFTGCSSLSKLSLSHNSLTGSIPFCFGVFTSLNYLNLSQNQLEGVIPASFGNFSSLVQLDLSSNLLNGSVPSFAGSSFMEELILDHNTFYGGVPNFTGWPALSSLSLSHNFFNGSIPDFTGCHSLQKLDLSGNRLTGDLPESVGQLSNLEYLDVSSNSLKGVISDIHFLNLTQLAYLDLSFNSFALEFSSIVRIPFQLTTIKLQSCKLGPTFPAWLETQRIFTHLDISGAGISDNVPAWFWDLPYRLRFLNISSNELRGTLPNMTTTFFSYPGMDLSNNRFEGRVPLMPSELAALNLSGNKFSGTIDFLCQIDRYLNFLDLSNNSFSGPLPDCWLKFQKKLVVLSLSNNSLSGEIPSSLGFLSQLEALYFGRNAFVGELPMSLSNCTKLRFADFGENRLTGNIPAWIGERLSELYLLVLRFNRFYGSLPSEICWLYNLQVLDLSKNGLSGSIPRCFGNLTAMARKGERDDITNHSYSSYVETIFKTHPVLLRGLLPCSRRGAIYHNCEISDALNRSEISLFFDKTLVAWKGKDREFGRSGLELLKSIDLSSNKLSGKLPDEITSLVELVSLNVSINKLHGEVPKDIGRLKSLDSLDLSRNEFSGHIPSSLSQLTFISYLDLSTNNLSGRIPTGPQLQRFNHSSYSGNPLLCGPPLTPTCGFRPPPASTFVGKEDMEEDDGDLWKSFFTGMGSGFAIGFWGVCSAIFLNRRCRHLLFASLCHVKDWIYVSVAVYVKKLQRKFTRF